MRKIEHPGRGVLRPAAAAAFLLLALGAASAPQDPVERALAVEGLTRADVGWRPKGWWSRFPADIPHKLRHFDDLFADPLATIPFARTAAAAARTYLAPEALAAAPAKSDGALYKAVHALGVERKFGAFRSYSANLTAPPTDPVDALLAVHEAAGRPVRFYTFGQDSPYPDYRGDLETALAPVPAAAREPIGRLVLNLLDAWRWTERAFRNVPPATRLAVQRRLDLGVELTDALDYAAEVDDAQRDLDEASLWYGGLKAVAALEAASHELRGLGRVRPFAVDWETPLGWVRIRGGGKDEVPADDAFLIVDLGGDDRYIGGAGATAPGRGLSALLDMGGDDVYEGGTGAAQGAGLAGVGVLLDAGGDDTYRAVQCAQGFGQIGLGVLADLGGDDRYEVRYSGQGAGLLGVGVLLDAAGDDRYRLYSDGQGFGGAGGVGTLADRSGDDLYEAVRDPAVTRRPSYHSKLEVAVSNAQGVGLGRRGDGGDGHSWAGGLGQLLDVEGNDRYTAGNWSMGTGYWFGTGILWDGAGDDRYEGVVWSQGSGAHFCIGALLDEAGDDVHVIAKGGYNSLAFAHDFTAAILLDGGGDDLYQTPSDGFAFSINRGIALFLEEGGNDTYRGRKGARPGTARFDERFRDRSGTSTYFADATSLALFLDLAGRDDYGEMDARNGAVWLDPGDSPNREVRNVSIGADRGEETRAADR